MPTGLPVVERTWIVGPLRVIGPTKQTSHGGPAVRWVVTAIDSVAEDIAEKVFPSAAKAQAFIDELVSGAPPVDPLAEVAPTISGACSNRGSQGQKTLGEIAPPTPPTLDGRHTRRAPGDGGPGAKGAKDPDAAPFNLKSVREALIQEGLDPFVEVARVLTERVPVMQDGKPVLDAEGRPITVPRIGGVDRAKILVELGQYVEPKLKAVEVKVEDKTQLTEDQLNARIARLFAADAAARAAALGSAS